MKMVPVDVEGDVRAETVAAGSKSERTAVTLRTAEGSTYVLQSQHGGDFGVDEGLRGLIGRRIHASGIAADRTLILRKWNLLD
jgi:hypothetical protein